LLREENPAAAVGTHPVLGEAQRLGESSSGRRLCPANGQADI
jgi:hypothetical protein